MDPNERAARIASSCKGSLAGKRKLEYDGQGGVCVCVAIGFSRPSPLHPISQAESEFLTGPPARGRQVLFGVW